MENATENIDENYNPYSGIAYQNVFAPEQGKLLDSFSLAFPHLHPFFMNAFAQCKLLSPLSSPEFHPFS